jgi:hypothetical protein
MDLKEIGCEDVVWMHGAVVNTLMKFGFHKSRGFVEQLSEC